jgi:hypothetical protein
MAASPAPGGALPWGASPSPVLTDAAEHPEPPRQRQGLGAGYILFIIMDILLVGIAAYVAYGFFGGGNATDTQSPAAGATVAQQTPTTSSPDTPDVPAESFRTESRNIACEISGSAVSCAIERLDTQPGPVAGCDGTVGYKVTMTGTTVDIPCVPASQRPKRADVTIAKLPYGESKTVGPYTCQSATSGVTCKHDESGKGFKIARAGIAAL